MTMSVQSIIKSIQDIMRQDADFSALRQSVLQQAFGGQGGD